MKKTIISSHLKDFKIRKDLIETHKMQAGDYAVFEIVDIGRHENVQMLDGINRRIFPGDNILAVFGDRYATAQYEGYVPDSYQEELHILGAGGIVGLVHSKNATLKDIEPTKLRLIGYCCNEDGVVINSKFLNKQRAKFTGDFKQKVILSIGSTMDSGKTTTAAFTARGLVVCGYRVGFIKLTGTCYTKDRELVFDCGAHVVKDFSDMGFPSTFLCSKDEILDIYQSLMDSLNHDQLDYIVMEIADGILQRETMFLLQDKDFMKTIDHVLFSSGDSLSAFHGIKLLNDWGVNVDILSGRMTMSPLLIKEIQEHNSTPIYSIDELMEGKANYLFGARDHHATLLEQKTFGE